MNKTKKIATQIAFLGTGLMGLPMCQNLFKAGFSLRCWNRTKNKTEPLAKIGVEVVETANKAIEGADFIISMLSDGAAVLELMQSQELLNSLKSGAIWIDMSSTKPEEGRMQAALLEIKNVGHLDAPVSGGTKGAENATLAIMAGGTKATFDASRSVLISIGRPLFVGDSGSGQLAKLANQAIVAITIGAVAEAMLLLKKGGADPAAVRKALKGGFADGTILQQHGARMTERNFQPGGPAHLQLKDLENVLDVAEQLKLKLPSTQHIRERFSFLVNEMELGHIDHSGLFLELEHVNTSRR